LEGEEFDSYISTEVKQENHVKKNTSNRNMVDLILELKAKTRIDGNLLELIGYNMAQINF
jgi:hypothetical protein